MDTDPVSVMLTLNNYLPAEGGLFHCKVATPAGNYMFKVGNRNTRTRCEICSKLTIKTPERRRSGVFIVNFEHISHLVSSVSIVNFEKVNASWDM